MNPPRPVPQPEADALRQATAAHKATRKAWEQTIRDAHAAGASLREIADLADVSRGTIATIIKTLKE